MRLTYCMAVPVPHKPVSPDSHKNCVKVSSLVRVNVMVLDRMYWHPNGVASEWIVVWGNPVKLDSPILREHHLIVWNDNIPSSHSTLWAKGLSHYHMSVLICGFYLTSPTDLDSRAVDTVTSNPSIRLLDISNSLFKYDKNSLQKLLQVNKMN